ncbi:MAG: response regulator [Deltaproteobacteria bacterium]|nr:response regulator [Deltaproteobacteria bacterium]
MYFYSIKRKRLSHYYQKMLKETILILDQEPKLLQNMKFFLEDKKYITIAVNNIDRAIKNFEEFEISALITEYWVNDSCTVDYILDLKKKFPGLYVMMLTQMDVSDQEYKKIINAGVNDLFLKPFSIERIFLHLQKGLRLQKLFLQKKSKKRELN